MSSLVSTLQTALAGSAERRARLALARELADYGTPAEQAELETMIERLDPESAAEIRQTLALVA